jgi:hypothetical protein
MDEKKNSANNMYLWKKNAITGLYTSMMVYGGYTVFMSIFTLPSLKKPVPLVDQKL